VAQANLIEALQSYRGSLAIVERLAKADPGNAGWQYGYSHRDGAWGKWLHHALEATLIDKDLVARETKGADDAGQGPVATRRNGDHIAPDLIIVIGRRHDYDTTGAVKDDNIEGSTE
jgi:hypothetical protein